MDDREDRNVFPRRGVDEPVVTDDALADSWVVELGHVSAPLREQDQVVSRGADSLHYGCRVPFRFAAYILRDCLKVSVAE